LREERKRVLGREGLQSAERCNFRDEKACQKPAGDSRRLKKKKKICCIDSCCMIFCLFVCMCSNCRSASRQHTDGAECKYGGETEFDMHRRAARSARSDPHDAYYGIKGIPRQSNAVIASVACMLILVGWLYFYLGFK